jgi:hypothetical protein
MKIIDAEDTRRFLIAADKWVEKNTRTPELAREALRKLGMKEVDMLPEQLAEQRNERDRVYIAELDKRLAQLYFEIEQLDFGAMDCDLEAAMDKLSMCRMDLLKYKQRIGTDE